MTSSAPSSSSSSSLSSSPSSFPSSSPSPSPSLVCDLRSDTVTHPTPSMYSAMLSAKLGDDVFDDDPTVRELQSLAASIMGKESSLFVPSGTMGNLISCLSHCNDRVSEMIVGDKSHIHLYEVGGSACLGGIHSRVVKNLPDGTFDLSEMISLIRPNDIHLSQTKLVTIENTHNKCGGAVVGKEFIDSVSHECHIRGIKVHMDGARIFNASTALGIDVKSLVSSVDSITFCLSKGLGSPVGSMICGTETFISHCRKLRKMIGGGMRQTGILAACGLVAIREMTLRLKEDHKSAEDILYGITKNPIITSEQLGWKSNPNLPLTNILFISFNLSKLVDGVSSSTITERLKRDSQVLVSNYGNDTIRIVTHYQIQPSHVQRTIKAILELVEELTKK